MNDSTESRDEGQQDDSIFAGQPMEADEVSKVVSITSVPRKRPVTPASSSEAEDSKQGARDSKKAKEIEQGKKRLAKLTAENAMRLPSGETPAEAARVILAKKWKQQGLHTLLRWNGDWYEWTGTNWACLHKEALMSKLWSITADAYSVKVIDDEEIAVAWCPNRRKIAELMEAMAAQTYQGSSVNVGGWLDGRVTSERYIACKNGLIRLSDLSVHPHTPAYFNTLALAFDYDKAAEAPVWLGFLDSVWGEDPESRLALQQWFAYVLSGRMDLHKLLLIVGAPRSGKGTIAAVQRALLGDENVSGPTLSDFEKNFGLADLVGKALAVIDDARLDKRTSGPAVERLLTIAGAGKLNIDRKNKDAWSGVLPTRLMILTNELPNLADSSGALMSRMRILPMTKSFVGREDRTLGARLEAEMPGILNWALEGLALLEEYGDIIQPSTAESMVNIQRRSGSPFGAFLEDCCNVGKKEYEVQKDELRAAWAQWCTDNGYDNDFENDAAFGRKVISSVPGMKESRKRIGGERVRVYIGIELDPDKAEREDESEMTEDYDPFEIVQPALDDEPVELKKGDMAMLPIVRAMQAKMNDQRGAVYYPGPGAGMRKAAKELDMVIPGGEMAQAFDRVYRARMMQQVN